MVAGRGELLVVDVEATCWEGSTPPGQMSEIIEIGLCLFDVRTGTLSGKRAILVRPQRSKVSVFCTQLTTLTQEQVDGGIRFDEACAILEDEYDARNRLWASWGAYDRTMFQSQCQSFEVRYPFGERHLNTKQLFADLRGHRPVGMQRALQMTDLSLEGTHHRGHDDAWNIGRLLAYMRHHYGPDILPGT